jgi:hypothetical protein
MATFRQLEEALEKIRAAESYQESDGTAETRVIVRGIRCADLDAVIWAATEYWNECAQGSALNKITD